MISNNDDHGDDYIHPFPESDNSPAVIGYLVIAAAVWAIGGLVWWFWARS